VREGKAMRPFWSLFKSSEGFKRTGTFFALTLASVAALAISSEPWKDKEYKSWTQDEVQKILYESPWVKMVETSAPWLKGRMQYLTPLPTDCDGSGIRQPDRQVQPENKIPNAEDDGEKRS
jgi:hypothetical protein